MHGRIERVANEQVYVVVVTWVEQKNNPSPFCKCGWFVWVCGVHQGEIILRDVKFIFYFSLFNDRHRRFVVSPLHNDLGKVRMLNVSHESGALQLVVHEAEGNAKRHDPDDDI